MIPVSQILAARKGGYLADMDAQRRLDECRQLILDAFAKKGMSLRNDELDPWAEAVEERLLRYSTMQVGEVAQAIQLGMEGAFGGSTYVTPLSIDIWANAYATLPERTKALRDAEQVRAAMQAPMIDYERERKHAEFVRRAPVREWNNFVKAGGQLTIWLDGYAAAVYDALVELGKMNPTAATIKEAQAQAEKEGPRRAPGFAGILPPAPFEMRVKRILLERYFRTLYDKGITPDFTPKKKQAGSAAEVADDLPS